MGDRIVPHFIIPNLMIETVIKQFVETQLEETKVFLLDIEMKGNDTKPKVIVYLDGVEGVSISFCAKISRKLGHFLEENEVLKSAYTLEVSSPGLDKPLTDIRQYVKNIGRNIELNLTNGEKLTGKITGVNNEIIDLELNNKNKVSINKSEVSKAKILISF